MGDMDSSRRSLLMAAAPLLLAAVAAGDKKGDIGDIRLSPAPKTGPDPNETFTLPYEKMNFESWATCRHTAAKWPCYTGISTSRAHTW
jgi:hypothetical protein